MKKLLGARCLGSNGAKARGDREDRSDPSSVAANFLPYGTQSCQALKGHSVGVRRELVEEGCLLFASEW